MVSLLKLKIFENNEKVLAFLYQKKLLLDKIVELNELNSGLYSDLRIWKCSLNAHRPNQHSWWCRFHQ